MNSKTALLIGAIITSPSAGADTINTMANAMVTYNGAAQSTDYHSGPQPTQSASVMEPTYGLSASADARATAGSFGFESVGVRTYGIDSQFDNWAAGGSADAQYSIPITVTAGGTINLPVHLEGLLHTDSAKGDTSVAATISLCRYQSGGCYAYGSSLPFSASASISDGVASSAVEFAGAVLANGDLALSATKSVNILLVPSAYVWTIELQSSSGSNQGVANPPVNVHADFYNSFGVVGGGFWQAVSGTASFYETGNPNNSYTPSQSVPEPATGALFGIGFLALCQPFGARRKQS